MEDSTFHIKKLVENTKHYVQTSAELYKLKAIDKAANGIATVSARLVILPFVILFFIIINVATAMWIGEALGRMSYGFFIVGGAYGFIGLVIYLFGNKLIKSPIRNAIIKHALKIELPWENRKPQAN